MGRRGPLPVPNSERLAPHAARQLDTAPPAGPKIEPPPVDETWHPRVQVWFMSLADTPQAAHYTRADWGHAVMAAGIMSDALAIGDVRTAAATLESASKHLLTTRPARLAARLDLDEVIERPAGEVLELPTNEQLRERTFGTATG